MRHDPRRPAFTLTELLVVVGLILVLTSLVLAVSFSTAGQRRVQRGAEQMQGWLLIAKQRAIRDRAPRGVRLVVNRLSDQKQRVTDVIYIDRPEPWTSAI